MEFITFAFSSDFGGIFFHRLIFCSSCPCYLQVADVPCAVSFQEAGKDHSLFAFCLALWSWVGSFLPSPQLKKNSVLSWQSHLCISHFNQHRSPSFCHSTCVMFCSPLGISVTRKGFSWFRKLGFKFFVFLLMVLIGQEVTWFLFLLLPTALAGELLGRNPDLC